MLRKKRISKFSSVKYVKFGVLALFVLVFAGVGSEFEFFSQAAAAYGPIVRFGGYCLDNANDKAADGNKIQLWQCLGNENQSWTVNGDASNPGTIVNKNGYCLGINNGGTANGTLVILYHCDGLVTQQWYYDSVSGQIVNRNSGTCLDDYKSNTNNGAEIDIFGCDNTAAQNWLWEPPTCPAGDTGSYPNCVTPTCPSGYTGTYPNCGAPKCPSGDTGTYPNCGAPKCPSGDTGTYPNCKAPSPGGGSSGGNPSPKPNPNGGSGGVSSGSSGSSSLGVSSTPVTTPSSGSSTPQSTTSSTLNTTITNTPEPTINLTGKPSVSNVEATRITASSITLTWQASDASDYIIRYGLSATNLPVSKTYQTTDAVPILTLSNLPAGKDIYIQITPRNNNENGSTSLVNFKTTGGSGSKAGAFILSVLIGVAIAFVFFVWKRKRSVGGNQAYSYDLDPGNMPVYPREDTAQESERLNWWMPDEQRQQVAHPQPKPKTADDTPDMFEEGRKRLEDEEKHHKLPGS